MFFAKIPRHTRQNAITEGDLECILTRNCEGTEQLQYFLFLFHLVYLSFPVPDTQAPPERFISFSGTPCD